MIAIRRLWERRGARALDVLWMAVSFLATTAQALAQRDGRITSAEFTGGTLIGLVGTVVLWWRRSHPVAVTVVGIAVYLVSGIPVVIAVGLFTLAVHRRDQMLIAVAAASAATFAVRNRIDGVEWDAAIVVAIIEAGFVVAAGSYVGARRDLLASLRERAVRAESERELRAEQAKAGERARIASEMHDVLAHKVSLIALHAGALEVNTPADPSAIRRSAELIRTTAHQAMEDLREVLGVLRVGADVTERDLRPTPRAADIRRLVDASREAGVRTELTMTVGDDLPEPIARTAYRIVQEGLTNVHKHARGADTSVTIEGDESSGIRVRVVNHRPVSAATLLPGSGFGHVGLLERVVLLGGTLESGATPDGGWRLAAWLPWHGGHHPASVGESDDHIEMSS
jgi:signal transduction histidine kinase